MAVEATSDDPVLRTADVHSQDIILCKIIVPGRLTDDKGTRSPERTGQDFKRFRKVQPAAPAGNSYESMIPFAKEPHREAQNIREMEEVARLERRRKASEVAADDLFNADKLKRQKAGATGRARASR